MDVGVQPFLLPQNGVQDVRPLDLEAIRTTTQQSCEYVLIKVLFQGPPAQYTIRQGHAQDLKGRASHQPYRAQLQQTRM